MRLTLLLLATTTLAACSGAGPTTVGGNAVQGGTGGVGTTPQSPHTFVNPTDPKTYQAIGGAHSYQYSTDDRNIRGQYAQLYAGDESTARNSGITVDYNPRDAIFKLTIKQPLGGVDQTLRFQDPLHRTAFGGAQEPQTGTPNITGRGIQYLEAGGSSGTVIFDTNQSDFVPIGAADAMRDIFTFFYQKPGTTTSYVTYAGFVRNNTSVVRETLTGATGPATSFLRQNNILERAAFVFGERSANAEIPRTGTGSFTGEMIATMVFNDQADLDPQAPTYFQWIIGNSTTNIDFAANSFTVGFTGTARAPQFDVFTNRNASIQAGATFTAAGSGRIDLVNAGGFLGQINSASFVNPGSATPLNLTIAGSSVDGAFFGPGAVEVGGGFRIVGGVPDERIDILGAFTGKKN